MNTRVTRHISHDSVEMDTLKAVIDNSTTLKTASEAAIAPVRLHLRDYLIFSECPMALATALANNMPMDIRVPKDHEAWDEKEVYDLAKGIGAGLVQISHALADRGCPEEEMEKAIMANVKITIVHDRVNGELEPFLSGRFGDSPSQHLN